MKKEILLLVSSYFLLFLITLGIGYLIFHNSPVVEKADSSNNNQNPTNPTDPTNPSTEQKDPITEIKVSNMKHTTKSERTNLDQYKDVELLQVDNYYDIITSGFKMDVLVVSYTQIGSYWMKEDVFSRSIHFEYVDNVWKLFVTAQEKDGYHGSDKNPEQIVYKLKMDNYKGLHYQTSSINLYY
ncbi:hypothetical protein SHELI_v1c08960 [Spiroplasma helicoides]|uniref:Uncharacterized protein n=1 Tax=Spiroplasma helicoides TaxID=216938 RepID=A0A1B3SLM7_9MOLU|nr:hypothetical protein [Spiroplasma helicoides]AOG60845.1 hypothetical protein SHELI_v1c08960 [Spiroplasma helicoides]